MSHDHLSIVLLSENCVAFKIVIETRKIRGGSLSVFCYKPITQLVRYVQAYLTVRKSNKSAEWWITFLLSNLIYQQFLFRRRRSVSEYGELLNGRGQSFVQCKYNQGKSPSTRACWFNKTSKSQNGKSTRQNWAVSADKPGVTMNFDPGRDWQRLLAKGRATIGPSETVPTSLMNCEGVGLEESVITK